MKNIFHFLVGSLVLLHLVANAFCIYGGKESTTKKWPWQVCESGFILYYLFMFVQLFSALKLSYSYKNTAEMST
jgi:hypothetical protein